MYIYTTREKRFRSNHIIILLLVFWQAYTNEDSSVVGIIPRWHFMTSISVDPIADDLEGGISALV